jgi:hypothetical protein
MTGKRILMRAGKAPHVALSPEASLAYMRVGVFATNPGNLLFATACYRHLKTKNTEVVTDGMTLQYPGVTEKDLDRINNEFDAVVLPLANAFRDTFLDHLERLADVVEGLKIPVVVTGVGGQAGIGSGLDENADVNAATRRFVAAVLDRSASIGVRGAATADYLRQLGFPADAIDIIGCPSMFDPDHARQVAKSGELALDDPMAITVTPQVPQSVELFRRSFEQCPKLIYVPQDYREMRLMMWGEPHPEPTAGMPNDVTHPVYRSGRMRMCVDYSTWSALMAEQRFVFGSRFHGAAAALHAGTPAVLLAHDSRTLELAEVHAIPVRSVEDLPADPRELYQAADFTEYNKVSAPRQQAYVEFLERNDLEHSFDPENRDEEYEALLAATEFPPPITPLNGTDPAQLVSRLHWLWQDPGEDRARAAFWYRPEERAGTGEFPQRTTAAELRHLQRQINRQKERIDTQRDRITALKQTVNAQGRILGSRKELIKRIFLKRKS